MFWTIFTRANCIHAHVFDIDLTYVICHKNVSIFYKRVVEFALFAQSSMSLFRKKEITKFIVLYLYFRPIYGIVAKLPYSSYLHQTYRRFIFGRFLLFFSTSQILRSRNTYGFRICVMLISFSIGLYQNPHLLRRKNRYMLPTYIIWIVKL